MAGLTLMGNVFLYIVNLLVPALTLHVLYLGVVLLLPLSSLFLICWDAPQHVTSPVRAGFPVKLMLVLCLVIFGLYVNGGLLYNTVYPAFQNHRRINIMYENVPYLAMLLLIMALGDKRSRRFSPYLGVTLLGMGFVVFGFLKTSLPSYFLTEGLVLAAFAVLDVFVWTLLADIGQLHGHSFRVFGFGLATNVFAIFVGGLLGAQLGGRAPDFPLLTGLLASGAICATVMWLPVMHACALEDFAESAPETRMPSPAEPASSWLSNSFPNATALTDRETEIVALIVGGDSNSAVARKLFISENTVKVHIKNINRKLGISNRNELLVTLMKQQNKAKEEKA
jgi:DNA-binding CsgD family transcriptional regulator